jgi:hypothetical protein
MCFHSLPTSKLQVARIISNLCLLTTFEWLAIFVGAGTAEAQLRIMLLVEPRQVYRVLLLVYGRPGEPVAGTSTLFNDPHHFTVVVVVVVFFAAALAAIASRRLAVRRSDMDLDLFRRRSLRIAPSSACSENNIFRQVLKRIGVFAPVDQRPDHIWQWDRYVIELRLLQLGLEPVIFVCKLFEANVLKLDLCRAVLANVLRANGRNYLLRMRNGFSLSPRQQLHRRWVLLQRLNGSNGAHRLPRLRTRDQSFRQLRGSIFHLNQCLFLRRC